MFALTLRLAPREQSRKGMKGRIFSNIILGDKVFFPAGAGRIFFWRNNGKSDMGTLSRARLYEHVHCSLDLRGNVSDLFGRNEVCNVEDEPGIRSDPFQAYGEERILEKSFHMRMLSCLALLLLLACVAVFLKESRPSARITELPARGTWEERAGKSSWTAWEPGESPGKRGSTSLMLRTGLPSVLPADAALFLPPYGTFQSFEVYLDDTAVYSSGELSSAFSNRHRYLKWHLIPLPPDSPGKKIVLRFHSTHHKLIGIISNCYIGNATDLITAMVLRDLDITALALLFIIVGTTAGIFSIGDSESRKRQLPLFAAMTILAGIYILTESRVTQLLVAVTPVFSYLHYTSFFIFIIAIIAFVENSIGSGYRGYIRWMGRILLVVTAGGTVLDLFSLLPWDITVDLGMWVLLPFLVPLAVDLIRHTLTGKFEARAICMGFSMVLLPGAVDLMGGLSLISIENQTIFPWGILLMFFCFLWLTAYNHRAEREKNEKDLQQSHERFRGLFEDAPVPIFQLDSRHSDYPLLRENSQARTLFGYRGGEFKRMRLSNLLAPGREDLLERIREQLSGEGKFIAECTGLRKNGRPFPGRIIATTERFSGSGQAILILEDLTLEKARRGEEAAIIEERSRIAREIHDGLAQDLAVMNMRAGAWDHIARTAPEKMSGEIDFFQKVIAKNIGDVRRCILALRPLDLEKLGFMESLRRMIDDVGKQHHMKMNLDTGDSARVPRRLELPLFRIVQEALNNTAKHADAKAVDIRMRISDADGIALEIRDDGKGFVPSNPETLHRNGHLGLKQMEERVKRENGVIHIEAAPGKGTRLSIAVPLTQVNPDTHNTEF